MEKNNDSQSKALELLKKADPKLIQKFLVGKIKINEAFAEEFIGFIDQAINKKISPQEFEKLFAKDLKEIKETLKKSVNQRTGSIDYKPRSPLNKLVVKSLGQIRAQAPTIELRIRCQLQILGLLINEFIEEYGDAYEDMLKSIIEDLEMTFKNGSVSDKKTIFEECMKFLREHESPGYEGEEVENFVLVSCEDDFKQEIIDYINYRIKDLLTPSSKSNFIGDRKKELGIYVEIMLGIMFRNGATEPELLKFANKFWDLSDVRYWFIWYFKETLQWDKGIKLAQDSVTFDKSNTQEVALCRSWLKDLYQLSGQTERYKEMLLTIIKDSHRAEIEAYRELKSLFPKEEWEKYRDQIFVWKREDDRVRAEYLVEENLIDRLALLILSPKTDYFLFDEYVPVLPKTYNNRILSKYETYFSQNALNASTRKDYQYVLSKLKDAYKIPGGKELANRLMSRWLVSYNNKPAFCEEIRKFRSQS